MAGHGDARLSVGEKIAYGLGDMAANLYLNFFGIFLMFFYVDLLGVAPAAIGTMLLVTKVVDAVTDPVMGIIADRTRSKWGSYRPYMLWGAVPLGVLGYATFAAPDLSPGWLLAYAYCTYSLVMLAYTVVNVPYSALLGVISPSSQERGSATAYRFFFAGSAGLVVGAFGTTIVREIGGGDERYGVTLAMAACAALTVFLTLISFAGTRERVPRTPVQSSAKGDLAVLLKTREWLILCAVSILLMIAITARYSTVLFYYRYVVGDDGSPVLLIFDKVAIFFIVAGLAQMGGAILGFALLSRMEKRTGMVACSIVQVFGLAVFLALPAEAFIAQLTMQAVIDFAFNAQVVLVFAMYTDVSETIEWRHRQQMTGLVISASIFALKFGGALGAAIPGMILQTTGFVAGQAQSEAAIWGINSAFTVLPMAGLALSMLVIRQYQIDRPLLRQIEQQLSVRRAPISAAI